MISGIHAFPTPEATTRFLAECMAEHLSSTPGTVRVALPGGSTPRKLYDVLVQEPFRTRIPWQRICWVLSDERCVPPDHPNSNYGMVRRSLWMRVGVDEARIVRFRGESPPPEAVRRANHELSAWTASHPLFDLVLLGVGEDGHTASLFPSPVPVAFGTSPVAHVFNREMGDRLTLTPAALSDTKALWFFALGEKKAGAIKSTLADQKGSSMHPIRALNLRNSRWFLDWKAADISGKGNS